MLEVRKHAWKIPFLSKDCLSSHHGQGSVLGSVRIYRYAHDRQCLVRNYSRNRQGKFRHYGNRKEK